MKRVKQGHSLELMEKFCAMSGITDVASVLKLEARKLTFILYILSGGRENQYTTFEITKKNGGKRKISAPQEALLSVQRRLNRILQIIYQERPSAHGFICDRSILTNAYVHKGKRFILNLDLKDFFSSINFGRVRGLFLAKPYSLNSGVATILAQIACYKGVLPQGGATSPIISNMICSRLDGELQRLAKAERCLYTRYADDITFSTNLKEFPSRLFDSKTSKLSKELLGIIERNGFSVNERKVRLQPKYFRQEVTGLIVNSTVNVKRTYVRNTRAVLHAWERYGLAAAERTYLEKFCTSPEHYKKGSFRNVIRGKIEFIRWVKSQSDSTDSRAVPLRMLDHFHVNSLRDFNKTVIRTEGKTDWMHMVAALNWFKSNGMFQNLEIDFYKSKDECFYGSQNLNKFCEKVKSGKIRPFVNKVICVFDADISKIAVRHSNNGGFIDWSGNVYSLVIPKPETFQRTEAICIEFLYPDSVLTKLVDGRRLYFSDEFGSDNCLLGNPSIVYRGSTQLGGSRRIIDSSVFDEKNTSIALTKVRFARSIYLNEPELQNVDFSGFKPLFTLLNKVSIC